MKAAFKELQGVIAFGCIMLALVVLLRLIPS